MQPFRPSSSNNQAQSSVPPMEARIATITHSYNGIQIQEIREPHLRFISSPLLSTKQKVLLDNLWNIRIQNPGMRRGQEKLVRALEQEFLSNRVDKEIALEEYHKLQAHYARNHSQLNSLREQHNIGRKQYGSLKEEHDTVTEYFRRLNVNHQKMIEYLHDIDKDFSASMLEAQTENPYFLQALARERFFHLPDDMKKHILKLEHDKHLSLQLAIQKFLFSLISTPQSGIRAVRLSRLHLQNEKTKYHILLASMNMEEFGEIYLEHDNSRILITPGLLIDHGFLIHLSVKSKNHVSSLSRQLRFAIEHYIEIWGIQEARRENIHLEFTSIPSAPNSRSMYSDKARHLILISRQNFREPPAILETSASIPTLEDIHKFRAAQLITEEYWNDNDLYLVYQTSTINMYTSEIYEGLPRPGEKYSTSMSEITKEAFDELKREKQEEAETMEKEAERAEREFWEAAAREADQAEAQSRQAQLDLLFDRMDNEEAYNINNVMSDPEDHNIDNMMEP